MPGTDNFQIIIPCTLAYYEPWCLKALMKKDSKWLSSFMLALSSLTLLKGDDCFEKQYDFSAGLSLKIWIINTSF